MSHRPGHSSDCRLIDPGSRERKAHKIMRILELEGYPRSDQPLCVDVGCAFGGITRNMAARFHTIIGVEPDGQAIESAADQCPNGIFLRALGQCLPLVDECADVIVYAQVYEHVDEPAPVFREIWRVLKPGGACFFSGPNKAFPIELHYRLPMVHWLPAAWASAVVRALGRGERFDVRLLTASNLREMLKGFVIKDYTAEILSEPGLFECQDEMRGLTWLSIAPRWLLCWLARLAPNFNWVLIKPERADSTT